MLQENILTCHFSGKLKLIHSRLNKCFIFVIGTQRRRRSSLAQLTDILREWGGGPKAKASKAPLCRRETLADLARSLPWGRQTTTEQPPTPAPITTNISILRKRRESSADSGIKSMTSKSRRDSQQTPSMSEFKSDLVKLWSRRESTTIIIAKDPREREKDREKEREKCRRGSGDSSRSGRRDSRRGSSDSYKSGRRDSNATTPPPPKIVAAQKKRRDSRTVGDMQHFRDRSALDSIAPAPSQNGALSPTPPPPSFNIQPAAGPSTTTRMNSTGTSISLHPTSGPSVTLQPSSGPSLTIQPSTTPNITVVTVHTAPVKVATSDSSCQALPPPTIIMSSVTPPPLSPTAPSTQATTPTRNHPLLSSRRDSTTQCGHRLTRRDSRSHASPDRSSKMNRLQRQATAYDESCLPPGTWGRRGSQPTLSPDVDESGRKARRDSLSPDSASRSRRDSRTHLSPDRSTERDLSPVARNRRGRLRRQSNSIAGGNRTPIPGQPRSPDSSSCNSSRDPSPCNRAVPPPPQEHRPAIRRQSTTEEILIARGFRRQSTTEEMIRCRNFRRQSSQSDDSGRYRGRRDSCAQITDGTIGTMTVETTSTFFDSSTQTGERFNFHYYVYFCYVCDVLYDVM